MNKHAHNRVWRRWGFYANSHLAYAGIAVRADAPPVLVRIIETDFHRHNATLPQRLDMEQSIRDQISASIEQDLGKAWAPVFRFEPSPQTERVLAEDVFGTSDPHSVMGS